MGAEILMKNIKKIIQISLIILLFLSLFHLNISATFIQKNIYVNHFHQYGYNTRSSDYQIKEYIIQRNQTNFILEDFLNESKISFKENVTVDTKNGEARLKKYELTFKTIGGSDSDEGWDIQETSDFGFIIVGNTRSYGAGSQDIWLVKTDYWGNEKWNKTFGGPDFDSAYSVKETNDRGYIILAKTELHEDNNDDIWLIKTDEFGNMEWNKSYGGKGPDWGNDIEKTSDGGFIIIGQTSLNKSYQPDYSWLFKIDKLGNIEWEKTFDQGDLIGVSSVKQTKDLGYILLGGSNSETAIIKTDMLGNIEWRRAIGENNKNNKIFGNFVKQTSDGGYIITGYTKEYISENKDVWLVKTNNTGYEQWNKTFDAGKNDVGNKVLQTPDGGFITIGTSLGSLQNLHNIWLIKITEFGEMQWNKFFGGDNSDWGNSILLTSYNKLIILGTTESYGKPDRDVLIIETDLFGNVNPIGILISNNLLEGRNIISIDIFDCNFYVPYKTNLNIQFSNDNESWYNSFGLINQSNELKVSDHFNLNDLNWSGSNFYYKIIFSSDYIYYPSVKNIRIYFTENLDSDFDGYLDEWEIFLETDFDDINDTPLDTDKDGFPDGDINNTRIWMDEDDDNDGYRDVIDKYPKDPEKWEEEEKKDDEKGFIPGFEISSLVILITIFLFFKRKRYE
jgi:hypothetical protein